MKRVISKWTALSVIGTILISVLQLYHSHGLSSCYIIFIMKAKSDSIWKGGDKKIPNCLLFPSTNRQAHTHSDFLDVNNETEKENSIFFPLKIPAFRYLDWFTFYVILMAQSGSKNFKCVCYRREESCDPQQRKLCSRRAH